VIAESSKVYLVKDIKEINKEEVFKPYKDLCAKIASIIKEYNPKYKYGHSLSTTIIEASHQQQYFAKHLPRLTDIKNKNEREYTALFLEELLFKVLS
jgi:archaellum biogenesis protein FlaJ (TadC family)